MHAPDHDHDPVERLKRVDEELRNRPRQPGEAPHEAPPAPAKPGMLDKLKSLKGRQGIKSLIAIAVALALGWIPLQRLLATTSAEATVNARLINLRAPIDGKVHARRPDARRRHRGRARARTPAGLANCACRPRHASTICAVPSTA